MTDTEISLCPDAEVNGALTIVQSSDEAGLTELARLLLLYPFDPRLHFLQGSVLAGVQRYQEGRAAMAQAIAIAPGFELARFQLGFLELTSGLAIEAATTWSPFAEQPPEAPFRLLAEGLNCLARDAFAECDHLLRKGMAANTEHPLINGDMQLILDEIRDKITSEAATPAPDTGETASATHQLLQQFELKDSAKWTKH
jgi:hypothetical protein